MGKSILEGPVPWFRPTLGALKSNVKRKHVSVEEDVARLPQRIWWLHITAKFTKINELQASLPIVIWAEFTRKFQQSHGWGFESERIMNCYRSTVFIKGERWEKSMTLTVALLEEENWALKLKRAFLKLFSWCYYIVSKVCSNNKKLLARSGYFGSY